MRYWISGRKTVVEIVHVFVYCRYSGVFGTSLSFLNGRFVDSVIVWRSYYLRCFGLSIRWKMYPEWAVPSRP